jgi:hypothetical protein
VLGALGEAQRKQAAPQRIDQAVARGVIGLVRGDFVTIDIVGDIDQYLIGIRALVHVYIGTHWILVPADLIEICRPASAGLVNKG